MDERVSLAIEMAAAALRAEGAAHKNCAQSVLLFMLVAHGEDATDLSIARYLGGGVAMTGGLCGTLTGAALALAVRDRLRHGPEWPDQKAAITRGQLQRLIADFTTRFGATGCRELTTCDFTTPEGYRRFRDDRLYENCVICLEWVCNRLAELP
jgi:C_GCAxxG_C_C family probable redox protein